ncbi:GNAT family N-acetyltransferase [Anaerocolumna sedimenticola]|uniref:GNAT family N-acetyltransferase n=1 Tax=Anaerocolumna sedimenticola TaxID=2696063 RepID=A0A6P1TK61_9FIRM|nr:GNAT family N-acetyltransferase [Anaerocolumna sedimenticola]QHQ61590.1 GNAT family N-acetyltransferase [Anaerocolumna sedimenticola]
MPIKFRNYTNIAGITEDYFKVRAFLVKTGYSEYTYARWDWMATHGWLDKSSVGKIGIWEDKDEIVGLATFDCHMGETFCLTLPEYTGLKKEILEYSKEKLSYNCNFGVIIKDTDVTFQDIAAKSGLIATDRKENDAVFYLGKASTEYKLPEGFYITTMKDTFDLYQYRRVLWKGFNHELNGEGEFSFSNEAEEEAKQEMLRPNVDLNLKVAVVAPDGNFVSYCGMWYDPEAGYAVIEPVATDPDYRNMGLGKAAVLEGISRVGKQGAKIALVGSSQQFYYSIGLRPYTTATVWKIK